MHRFRIAAAAACAVAPFILIGRPGNTAPPSCADQITRSNVVACAIEASSTLRMAAEDERASAARVDASRVLLPSNPEVSGRLSRRSDRDGATALNWSAELAQEIEIAGQRGVRVDAAEKARRASRATALATKRAVAARALIEYFEVLAARESLALNERIARVAESLTTFATARAKEGVGSRLDAEVAYAEGVRLLRARAEAVRRQEEHIALLAGLLALDPRTNVKVDGVLAPLAIETIDPSALERTAESNQPEIRAKEAEHEALLARIAVLERERVPNITVSGFVERDGFGELVLGGGLALPIPLPSPIGRTNAGEIAEAEAEARRSAAELELLQRTARIEITTAAKSYDSLARELAIFDVEHLKAAEASLTAIAEEITAGRLGARDALTAEQSLLSLLEAHLEARRAVSIASVELVRIAGIPFEGETP